MSMNTSNIAILPYSEQKQLAQSFAEGSEELEQILLLLWKNGINTVACCAGHGTIDKPPYIMIDSSKFSDRELRNLFLDTILTYNGEIDLSAQNDIDYQMDNIPERKTVTFKLINNNQTFAPLLTTLKELFANNIDLKLEDVDKYTQNFVCDLLTVNKINLKNYQTGNPLTDVVAIGINDIREGYITVTTKEVKTAELYNKEELLELQKYFDDETVSDDELEVLCGNYSPCYVSPNTYNKYYGNFIGLNNNGEFEILLHEEVKKRKLIHFDKLAKDQYIPYSHKKFTKTIENIVNNGKTYQ